MADHIDTTNEDVSGACKKAAGPYTMHLLPGTGLGAEQPNAENWGQIALRPGLWISKLELETCRTARVCYHKRPAMIDFGFVLSGNVHHRFPDHQHRDMQMNTGIAGVGHFPDRRGIIDVPGGSTLRVLHVYVTPERLHQLVQDDIGALPPELRSIVEGNLPRDFLSRGKMDPAVQAVAHDVFFGRFAGLPKTLYLECKALELIALQLRHLMSDTRNQPAAIKLSRSEIDRIRAAHDCLVRDLSAPPTLDDLSRRYCLSLNKLQRGFHVLYGDSVYGCLREYKMQKARQLFETVNLNVSQVAWEVGYVNISHFTRAFKKRFGILPKHYLRSFRNNRLSSR